MDSLEFAESFDLSEVNSSAMPQIPGMARVLTRVEPTTAPVAMLLSATKQEYFISGKESVSRQFIYLDHFIPHW